MSKGFTLLEVLLVISMVGILAGFSMPVMVSAIAQNAERNAEALARSLLRTARRNAYTGKQADEWSVRVEGNQIVMFLGDSFATRDQSFDIVQEVTFMDFPINQVTFEQGTGLTSDNGLDLGSTIIGVNQYGLLE